MVSCRYAQWHVKTHCTAQSTDYLLIQFNSLPSNCIYWWQSSTMWSNQASMMHNLFQPEDRKSLQLLICFMAYCYLQIGSFCSYGKRAQCRHNLSSSNSMRAFVTHKVGWKKRMWRLHTTRLGLLTVAGSAFTMRSFVWFRYLSMDVEPALCEPWTSGVQFLSIYFPFLVWCVGVLFPIRSVWSILRH